MIRVLQVCLIAIFCLPGLALAQTRDLYTVTGLSVDVTAETVLEAQRQAYADARLAGARIMIDRLTLAEDRAALPTFIIDEVAAEMMAAAVDIEEETRGAGRYRGKLSVVYNPTNVRAFLDQSGLPYIDRQAPLGVIVPVTSSNILGAWIQTWPEGATDTVAPTITSRSRAYTAGDDWTVLGPEAGLYGARRAILADLTGRVGNYRVALYSVTPAGRTELGVTRRAATLNDAVAAAEQQIEDAWKNASIVREAGQTLVQATVRYTSLIEWNTLRRALVQSPLVSEFKTEAVSRDGAVIAFVFAGNGER